jgi:hypothetical protein
MIIFHKKKIIYFHAPKSGGTSVSKYLDRHVTWSDIVIGGTERGEAYQNLWSSRFGIYKHSTPIELINVIGAEEYQSFRKFVVVRNPVSRFKSAYNFLRSEGVRSSEWFKRTDEANMKIFDLPLKDFIETDYVRAATSGAWAEMSDVMKFFAPQRMYWDTDEADSKRFFFFKMEDLVVSTKLLNHFLDIDEEDVFPHDNKTVAEGPTLSYELKRRVEEIYMGDLNVFRYHTVLDRV